MSYDTHVERKSPFDIYTGIKLMLSVKYPNFATLIKLVSVISHGQSNVERGFNINDDHARTNIFAEGLTVRRMIVDYLHAEDITAETFKITKELFSGE